ncbi:tetratricopeptide repeat protein [Candidatus Sumerlaeota bacterium]|nr:tetratricopeptide repeat protein [Candidatus Sumerlaeota bacterium]
MSSQMWRRTFNILMLMLALTVMGSMTACKKKTAEERLKEAMTLLQEQQLPLAQITLKDIIDQFPDDPATNDARLLLARVYVMQGRRESIPVAINLLKTVHDKLGFADPRGMEAYQGMVELTAQNDDLPGAIKLAQDAAEQLKDKPQELAYMTSLVQVLQLSSSDEETQKLGIKGMEATMLEDADGGVRGTAREQLAQFHRQKGDFAASNEVYNKYLAKYPDDPIASQLYMAQAINFKQMEDQAKSDEAFAKGEELMKKEIEGELNLNERAGKLNTLATFYGAAGRVDDAEKQYRRIMAEQPATRLALDSQFAIAKLYIQNKMYDKADELLAQMEKENANTPVAQSAQSWRMQLAQQRKEEAAAATAGDAQTTATATSAATAP